MTYNLGFGLCVGLLPFLCFYLAESVSEYAAVSFISISAVIGVATILSLGDKCSNLLAKD